MRYRLLSYETSSGKRPFDAWLDKLRRKDARGAAAVDARLARVRDNGNFGDYGPAGEGVQELRIHLGPGYRVYYLLHGQTVVVLLIGGLKKEQTGDIAKAHEYAADFRRRI